MRLTTEHKIVYEYIRKNPYKTIPEITLDLNYSQRTVENAVSKLYSNDKVQYEEHLIPRVGYFKKYYVV